MTAVQAQLASNANSLANPLGQRHRVYRDMRTIRVLWKEWKAYVVKIRCSVNDGFNLVLILQLNCFYL